MNTSDRSIAYDLSFVKTPRKKKNYLANRVNKFQEIVDEIAAPSSSRHADLANRGRIVQEQVLQEMKELCQTIETNGKRDGQTIFIRFGDLFSIYTDISSKLVGILLKARRHGYLMFPGEMLLQNRDEDIVIHLNRSPQE